MIEQIGIAATGVTAVWLSQHESESKRKYACLFGLAAQPFWLYSSYTAGQWGIFALSFLYTYGWIRGFRTYWRKR